MMEFYFKNDKGRKLYGILSVPDSKTFPLIILCHGKPSDCSGSAAVELSKILPQKGIAVFRFDFTGSGESEGTESEFTVDQGVFDLKSAYTFASSVDGVDKARIAVLGSSFSGGI